MESSIIPVTFSDPSLVTLNICLVMFELLTFCEDMKLYYLVVVKRKARHQVLKAERKVTIMVMGIRMVTVGTRKVAESNSMRGNLKVEISIPSFLILASLKTAVVGRIWVTMEVEVEVEEEAVVVLGI